MQTLVCASRSYALAIVTCLLVNSFWTTALGQEADTSSIIQGTTAEPLERIPPEYPWRALRRAKEGWVLLSFVITKQGTISDVVVKDTSGVKDLEAAAEEAVSKWRYKPATWNGMPVEQCHTFQKVTFKTEDYFGARPSYVRKAKAASRFVADNKFDEAQLAVDNIFEQRELNLYETSRLWLIQFQIDIGRGDERKAFRSIKRVWAMDGDTIEEELHDTILSNLLLLELEHQQYGDAINTFERLKQVKGGLKGRAELVETMNSISAMFRNPGPIGIDGLIENDCNCENEELSWDYQLLRSKFGIESVAGQLSHIELWCDYKKVVDTSIEERVWEILESWGQCRLQVHADEGTTFKLVEYASN